MFGGKAAPEPRPAAELNRPATPTPAQVESEERHALDQDRIGSLELEIERLYSDLEQAEAIMLATDSEVRAGRNRATAVSVLAEAHITLERAEALVSWDTPALEEAKGKLAEAERQIKSGHPSAAVYFASRGQRMAESLIAEARLVATSSETRFVRVERLNLREGPSTERSVIATLTQGTPIFAQRVRGNWARVRTVRGELGWVYASLLEKR